MGGSRETPASVDYDTLAPRYDRHRTGAGPYMDAIVEYARAIGARAVLELGAGTGNASAEFLRRFPCRLTCLERSRAMLAAAREKSAPGRWVNADALALPFAARAFEFIYSVFMVHHVRDLASLVRECARCATRAVAFVTTTHGFVERHPMNAYFPSFAAIDKARFQPLEAIAHELAAAGFSETRCDTLIAPPVPIDARYVEKIAGRFISTYDLVPPDEFAAGLNRLRADVARKGQLDAPIAWECACVVGFR